ncbi:uncharacterized [Tachysurus ichikawai]
MITPATSDGRLRHYKHSQLSALAVELSYYLDRLYTTDTVNYTISPVTISHQALCCDATTQTDPIISPPVIARSTQTPLHSWNYRYACGPYDGLRVNPVSPYTSSSPRPFSPPSPAPSSSYSSSPSLPSPPLP